jgi:23S rRNA-/tRNA-specific pseudouridylate synthase
MVVFKPAGLATQSPPPYGSLEVTIGEYLSDASNPDRYVAFPHRLDRPVSGVILVALTKRAANLLSQQFEFRKVQKRYLAWVEGDATACQSRWEDSLRKLPDQPRCEIASPSMPDAKTAITTVRVVGRSEHATLVELSPLTGRMHQLRLQCSHRGHPILGDALYGSRIDFGADCPDTQTSSPMLNRQSIALHAVAIEFHDPANGKRVVVEADPLWQPPFQPPPMTRCQ